MRHALACLLIAVPVAAWAQGRASTNDDISNALGGTSWYPPAARPKSPADPANTGRPSTASSETPGEAYIRSLLNYDISQECRVSISARSESIAAGRIVPERDIPDCIQRDNDALKSLSSRWNTVSQQSRESCLAAFGRGGANNALRYMMIAQCVGLYKP